MRSPVHRTSLRTQIRTLGLRCVPCPLHCSHSIFPAAHQSRLHDSRAPASGWIAHARASAAQLQLEGGPVDTAQCAGFFLVQSAQSCLRLYHLRAGRQYLCCASSVLVQSSAAHGGTLLLPAPIRSDAVPVCPF
ncbi:hypothetical protein B0H13DRAFT_2362301 [Mycena leptocephala]|nr:hypothetical protein B0H13DRAFT_2362301 [Mycena leptocephala]